MNLSFASFLSVGFVAAIASAGCLSKPALVRETFYITGPEHPAEASPSAPVASLAFRQFTVAPGMENRSFLYRISDDGFEQDPYAELLVPPSRALPQALRAHLRQTGVFQRVNEPGSNAAAKFQTEAVVTEFFGDFRVPAEPKAVLSLRFTVFDGTAPVLEKEFQRRIPIPARTASALAAGWNQALREIATEFAASMKARSGAGGGR